MLVLNQHLRRVWRAAVRLNRRIEDGWVGDLIGVVGLFSLLFTFLFFTEVFR